MGEIMKRIIIALAVLLPVVAVAEPQPTLIGGRHAEPGEFPEVIYIKHRLDDGRTSRCSASVVGPRVILTAAHCVKDNGTIEPAKFHVEQALEFQIGQQIFKAQCKQAPLYRDNTEDHDMALCKTDREMNVKYASIAKEGPAVDDFVQLTGYGCIQEGGGGGNDGILRVGEAKVRTLPTETNNWFYTRWETALCFGDSGGPSFFKMEDAHTEHHWVIGVNSRGNIRDLSLMTATWIEKSQKFIRDFASEQSVEICGHNRTCGGQNPDPDPDPEPEPDCEVEKSMVRYYQGRLLEWEVLLHKCLNRTTPQLPWLSP